MDSRDTVQVEMIGYGGCRNGRNSGWKTDLIAGWTRRGGAGFGREYVNLVLPPFDPSMAPPYYGNLCSY